MKRIITLLSLLVLLSVAVQAQGELQFNQAKFIKMNFTPAPNISYQFIEQVITVPAGKVWKLESAAATFISNQTSPNPNYSSTAELLIDKVEITGRVFNAMPMWLPAGTYTLRLVHDNSTSGNANEVHGIITAIEFNVTP